MFRTIEGFALKFLVKQREKDRERWVTLTETQMSKNICIIKDD